MGTPSTTAEGSRGDVEMLVRQRRFADAAALAARLRAATPHDDALATLHAFALHGAGRYADAAGVARTALDAGSVNPTTAYLLGDSQRRLGQHAEAAAAFARAHERLPDRADIAALLLEETAAAEGLAAARPLFHRLAARLPGGEIAAAWARLAFAAGEDAGLPPGFVSAPVMSVPDWAQRADVALDWTGEAEELPWEDPVIAGEPDAQRRRFSTLGYTPYVATLRGATILSKSNMVLAPDGAVLNDTTADRDYGRVVTNFMSERAVAARRGDQLLLNLGQYRIEPLDAALHLSGSASEHFGHWIAEYLPRLNLLRHHPRFAELPLVVDAVMPPQHLEYLGLVVDNPVITLPPGGGFRCRELVVAAPTAFFPVHFTGDHGVPPEKQQPISVTAFRYIRERVLEKLGPPHRTDRRIYLSRIKRGGRRPPNEAEIGAWLADRGFEVLIPEELSFADQVRAFQEASVIVAPNGSSLMNAIFAPPGAQFFVLSQRGIFNWGLFCGWMTAMDYRTTFICGRRDTGRKHDNYEVSIEELAAGLAPVL